MNSWKDLLLFHVSIVRIESVKKLFQRQRNLKLLHINFTPAYSVQQKIDYTHMKNQ